MCVCFVVFFFNFFLFRAAPAAYGSSQARDGIRAAAVTARATPDQSCI